MGISLREEAMSRNLILAGCHVCHAYGQPKDMYLCSGCEKPTCEIHGAYLTQEVDQSLTKKIWVCDSCMGIEGDPILMSDEQVKRLGGNFN